VITPAAIGPQYFREAGEVINEAAGGLPERAKMAVGHAPPRPHASDWFHRNTCWPTCEEYLGGITQGRSFAIPPPLVSASS
jgi:hypothetical protein